MQQLVHSMSKAKVGSSFRDLDTLQPAAMKPILVMTVQCAVQVKAESCSGMARPGPDPTALLRLYIKYDRLEDAADLAASFLTQWERQVSTTPHVLHPALFERHQSSLLASLCTRILHSWQPGNTHGQQVSLQRFL